MRSEESYEKAEIDKYLKLLHCWYFAPMMNGFGGAGVPDRVGLYKGKFFAIEVKRPGKEPTPLQWRRMREIEENGGKAFWGTAEKVCTEMEAWARSL